MKHWTVVLLCILHIVMKNRLWFILEFQISAAVKVEFKIPRVVLQNLFYWFQSNQTYQITAAVTAS